MSQNVQQKPKNPKPVDGSHKKLLIGLAILIILMFAMIAAITIRLS